MYLIERYIIRETRRLVMVVVSFLVFIFAIYSVQRYLTAAANGTLALEAVVYIVFYKVIIAMEMLLPAGLYVATAIALGQLYNDSEMTAIFASGISPTRVYKAILMMALPIGIAVTLLSLYGRPWAYAQIDKLQQQSQMDLDVRHLQAKKFNLDDNGRMILAQHVDASVNHLSDTLIYKNSANFTTVFRAHSARIEYPSATTPVVTLQNGTAYKLERHGTSDNRQIYHNLQLHPKVAQQDDETRSKSIPVAKLVKSNDPADRAELQWRESRGVSAILMTLLAISLSRTKPRQGRFATLLPLALVFVLIFFGGNVSRTLMADGSLPAFPGVWLLPLVMLITLLAIADREFYLVRKLFR